MEKQLENYRLRKRRKVLIDKVKEKLTAMIPFYKQKDGNNCAIDIPDDHSAPSNNSESPGKDLKEDAKLPLPPVCSELDSDYVSEDDDTIFPAQPESPPNPIIPTNKYFRYIFWIIIFMFWATCYAIAIELKFGMVYLIISALFGIYFNTRTTPKKAGEISAYSVFNKNCHAIDGTLNAEQFEREIRYGPANVR